MAIDLLPGIDESGRAFGIGRFPGWHLDSMAMVFIGIGQFPFYWNYGAWFGRVRDS